MTFALVWTGNRDELSAVAGETVAGRCGDCAKLS